MADAGLGHLMGGALQPKDFIRVMMSKQRNQAQPYSRANVIRPFDPEAVANPSRDIQRKYLVPPRQMRPFDACAAQERRQEAAEAGEPEGDPEAYSIVSLMVKYQIPTVAEAVRRFYETRQQRCDVFRPEYWGLRWEDLRPAGNWYVNQDGLRFPPVQWRDPRNGRLYWGLACCGGTPEEPGKRNKYTMLYFREGEAPEIEEQLKDTAARKRAKSARENPELRAAQAEVYRLALQVRYGPDGRRQPNPEYEAALARYNALAQAPAGRDQKNYRGVTLEGTDAVKARTAAQTQAQRARAGEGPRERVHEMTEAQRRERIASARAAINRYKQENPEAGRRCAQVAIPPQAGRAAASSAAAAAPRGPAEGVPRLVIEAEPEEEEANAGYAAPAPARPPPAPSMADFFNRRGPAAAAAPPAAAAAPPRALPQAELEDDAVRAREAQARALRAPLSREAIRDAYNAARVHGVGPLKRLAVLAGVPDAADLDTFQRSGIMKRIIKHAPLYDINTGARKAQNGDILEMGDALPRAYAQQGLLTAAQLAAVGL
jgi:hypothetical protein